MKIFISADIEGITGVTHWDECIIGKPGYESARIQMTKEVFAACQGALEVGAEEIWVKDAHDSGRNLFSSDLPRQVTLIRGWSGHPYSMVQELDQSFDACFMIGYHSRAASGGSPLAHTMSGSRISEFRLNGVPVSEYHLFAYAAALEGVPVALVSGDEELCRAVRQMNSHTAAVAVKKGFGDSTVSMAPERAEDRIRSAAVQSLSGDLSKALIPLPDHFKVQIRFSKGLLAYQASFYPGAELEDDLTVLFETDNYFEVLRMMLFTV